MHGSSCFLKVNVVLKSGSSIKDFDFAKKEYYFRILKAGSEVRHAGITSIEKKNLAAQCD